MDNKTLALVLSYRILIIAGCVYLVGWREWSAWWFVLAILACEVDVTAGKNAEDET